MREELDGVMHELRNALQIATMSVEVVRRRLAGRDSTVDSLLDLIEQQIGAIETSAVAMALTPPEH